MWASRYKLGNFIKHYFDDCIWLLFTFFTWELAAERADGYTQGGIRRRPCKLFRYEACSTSHQQQRHLDLWYFVRSLLSFSCTTVSSDSMCREDSWRRIGETGVECFCLFFFFFKALTSIFSSAFLQQLELKRGRQESFIPTAGACSKHLKLQNSLKREWESASLGKSGSVSLWDQLELYQCYQSQNLS